MGGINNKCQFKKHLRIHNKNKEQSLLSKQVQLSMMRAEIELIQRQYFAIDAAVCRVSQERQLGAEPQIREATQIQTQLIQSLTPHKDDELITLRFKMRELISMSARYNQASNIIENLEMSKR